MILYLLTLFIVFLLAYVAQTRQKALEGGVIKKTSSNGKWAIAGVCAVLIFVGGFRQNVGADYGMYWQILVGWEGGFEGYMNMSVFETLFETDEGAVWSIASFVGIFTTETWPFYFICQVIVILCFIPTMAKYSHNLSLTVFLYLAAFDFFSSFNGIRQWVAAAILFAAFPMLKEKKIGKYCLMCVFAYFFHNSAIMMIPIALFAMTSPFSKWNVWALTIIGMLILLMPNVFDSLLGAILNDKYTQYINMEGDDGIHVFRVAIALLPMLLARIFYKKLYKGEEDKKFLDMLINLSTVNFVLNVVGLRATYLARMSMYVSPFNCLLIPYLLRAFKKESRMTAKAIIMALFGLYLIIMLPVDAMVLPYRNIFGWYFA